MRWNGVSLQLRVDAPSADLEKNPNLMLFQVSLPYLILPLHPSYLGFSSDLMNLHDIAVTPA